MTSSKKGFTLIELLVVIAIIGLLAALAIISLGTARSKARDAKRLADIKSIQSALELYNNENGGYPVAAAAFKLGVDKKALCNGTGPGFAAGTCDPATQTAVMAGVPADPGSSAATVLCAGGVAAPCDYSYTAASATGYKILFSLEKAAGNLVAGANCATPAGNQAGVAC